MSLNAEYENDNIFAKIVRGDIPSARIWEDDNILAFMDAFPQVEGHCLVIHKSAPATNLLSIDADHLATLSVGVQKTARAVVKALSPDGVRIVQFNGAPAGQTVFHLHFHILPVKEGTPMQMHGGAAQANMDDLKALADKIAAAVA